MKPLFWLALGLSLITAGWAQDGQKKPGTAVRTSERKAQVLAQTQERIRQIDAVLKSVPWAPVKGAAKQTSELEAKSETEFDSWLATVRTRYEKLKKDMQFGSTHMDDPGMVEKMAEMNMQFVSLQQATQMESRRFQTLSNASKARHDAAMNAIRNLK